MQIYRLLSVYPNKTWTIFCKIMKIIDRIYQYIECKQLKPTPFEQKIGVSSGYLKKMFNRNADIGESVITKFAEYCPDVSIEWLLTGRGEMLKNTSDAPIVSYSGGVPYYDVDFIGGYELVENDQTLCPAYNIDFEPYNKADSWVNITGHSMEPTINHGDIIALKRVNDWNTYLLYGEIYAIVTDEYRTVKRVRKSDLGTDYIRLVPVNDGFDEQDIRRNIIRHVYQVIGSMRRFF